MQFQTRWQSVLPTASQREALRELREAGGEKRLIHCKFNYAVGEEIIQAGWAIMSQSPVRAAVIRITVDGRLALSEPF